MHKVGNKAENRCLEDDLFGRLTSKDLRNIPLRAAENNTHSILGKESFSCLKAMP